MHIRDGQVLADLLKECKFYGLQDMITLILTRQTQIADLFHNERAGRSRSRKRSNSPSSSCSITRYENTFSSGDEIESDDLDTLKLFSLY
jgi:hypothetical protein